ncbi:MAG: hypothetical protein R3236_00640, partial [Phycisphaeraceae bacterium]|nr:hypothetical protein [Phycisphaeraceae bacterium]
LKVLLISDADSRDRTSGAFFVQKALSPAGPRGRIRVDRRIAQDVDRGILETADVFVLVCPVTPSGEAFEIMARRVQEGAGMMCFLDGASAVSLISALSSQLEGALRPPYIVSQVKTVSKGRESIRLTSVKGGPLEEFRDPLHGDLSQWRFGRYLFTEDDYEHLNRGRKAARYPDRSVALGWVRVDSGKVAYINMPVAPESSTLPGNPNFPVFVHELLRLLRDRAQTEAPQPGHEWSMNIPQTGAVDQKTDYTVMGPDRNRFKPTVLSRGASDRLSIPPVSEPGPYTVFAGDEPVATGVVNLHASETDTRRMALEAEVEQLDAAKGSVSVLDDAGQIIHSDRGVPLWPYLAAAAAILIALEMLLLGLWRRTPRTTQPAAAFGGKGAA